MKNMPADPNSQESWDAIWSAEGDDTWRTYPQMYSRVVQLVPPRSTVLDLGCGVGKLLDRLRTEKECFTYGIDISPVACDVARQKGHGAMPLALSPTTIDEFSFEAIDCIVAVEFLEHLNKATIDALLDKLARAGKRAIFAVPNNCMGPDVEPQHRHQWTAVEFKKLLSLYFKNVRVECLDDGAPRLIGVCNFPKPYKLAFTMPVKNEARDIERVLKSFRGAADHVVIGIDDKTTDATEEIVRQYADHVFFFTWENDFSKARNACLDKCHDVLDNEQDWIFMSEGHEHLESGLDELLNLDVVPAGIHTIEVRREDRDHAWMFPWVTRNRKDLYYENAAHNALVYDERRSAKMPAIRTWHEPHAENRKERSFQRRYMNRQVLLEKLAANPKDDRSCYYLANEWRTENPDKAIEYYERYLAMGAKNGAERYQARLALSQLLIHRVTKRQDQIRALQAVNDCTRRREVEQQQDMQLAYDTLIQAVADDWSRNEHWIYLGDMCATQGDRLEQAMRFYELAAVSINREPLTFMWIEKANYSWVPAQKLVTIYAQAGMLPEALHWNNRVAELLPTWAPPEARDEVERHRQTIIEKMREVGQ